MFKKPILAISTLAMVLLLPLLTASAQDAPAAKEAPAQPEAENPKREEMPQVAPSPEIVPAPPKTVAKDVPSPAPPQPMFAPTVPMPPPPPVPITVDPGPRRTGDIIVSKDGDTAQLVGQITDGIANRLKAELLKNRGIKTLVLTSEGGLLLEGAALAHIVRKHNLNTHVEFVCGSACTFPLLAGKERSLAPGALVGFHQASTMVSTLFGNTDNGDDPGNKLIRNTYASAGVGSAIIDGTMATPPADMWFPDAATLSANGVITRSAKAGEYAMTMSDWNSATEYRAALDSDPLWAAAKTARPEDYAFAAGSGWILAGRQKDKATALRAARAVLIRRVLASAPVYPDGLLDEFFRTEQAVWADSESAFNRDCDYGSTIRFPVSAPEKKEQRSAQLAIFQKMMAIAPKKGPPDEAARSDARAVVMDFWGRMVAEQSFNSFNVATNFCREPLSYFDEMSKMRLADRVNLLRSLIVVQAVGMR